MDFEVYCTECMFSNSLDQGWAINFPKGPHEKLGRLQRAVGRVYGGGGGV